MRQVFRLMDLPDRVLAFDELPERFLTGLDMCKADGFPRHWKEWMGKRKKMTRIPPEKNPLTGQIVTYKPMEEEDYFFYVVDWNIRSQEDKWKEITEYVRLHAPQDMRIPEKLEDMGKPLAKDKMQDVTLEPEEVPVIPIPKENEVPVTESPKMEIEKIVGNPVETVKNPIGVLKCEDCDYQSDKKQALYMHRWKKHNKQKVKVAA